MGKKECEKYFLLTSGRKIFVVSMCLVLLHYKIEDNYLILSITQRKNKEMQSYALFLLHHKGNEWNYLKYLCISSLSLKLIVH